ncbi:hypothetical protein C8R47DRAFT_1068222 [Mycena vitilis]|nr:hypothetical protein C8R47DRAFT_1068222 [Mycena vitilis]
MGHPEIKESWAILNELRASRSKEYVDHADVPKDGRSEREECVPALPNLWFFESGLSVLARGISLQYRTYFHRFQVAFAGGYLSCGKICRIQCDDSGWFEQPYRDIPSGTHRKHDPRPVSFPGFAIRPFHNSHDRSVVLGLELRT